MSAIPFGLLTSREVCRQANISRSTLDRFMREDPNFPKPYRPTPNSLLHDKERFVRWLAGYQKGKHKPKQQPHMVGASAD